jgi:phosphonate transport system permease protein
MWRGKRLVVLCLLAVFLACAAHLGPNVVTLSDGAVSLGAFGRFARAAFTPSLVDQNESLPPGATPFLERVGGDLLRTIRYAMVAMSVALPAGLVLGFFASSAWWPGAMTYGHPTIARRVLRVTLHALRWSCRFLIVLFRSIHELIWAMFFLSAVGDAPITGCVALALPFAGSMGRIFSELSDEQWQGPRSALLATGASPLQAYLASLFPQSLPDLMTYGLYRFECALRSSAVLGFIGLETIGLGIRRSFENLYYGEVWTQLYALIIVIVLVDMIGARLRERLNHGPTRRHAADWPAGDPAEAERILRRSAPRDRLVRYGLLATVLGVVMAWNLGDRLTTDLTGEQRSERLGRFVTKLTPEPARPDESLAPAGDRWSKLLEQRGEVAAWAADLWKRRGAEALLNTVVIATAAILLAGMAAVVTLPLGIRSLARSEPFGMLGVASRLWVGIGTVTRSLFILSRAVPEYLYAYLLVSLLGPSAWPLVFALALHNFGILGRLWGEVAENQRPEAPRQWIRSGASRGAAYLGSLAPLSFNRFLLFFFYRWETCIREATILGMLGISSLGYYISISRNYFRYDQMLFYVLLGVAVIFAGDLLSDWLRRRLRGGAV